MITNKQNRELNRYRDIGSGISWKLLPSRILNFLFHPYIQAQVLNIWATSEFLDRAYWNKKYGIGYLNESDQLRVFVATRLDIENINNLLNEIGTQLNTPIDDATSIINSLQRDQTHRSKRTIELIVEALSQITIAKVYDYSVTGRYGIRGDMGDFIRDHVDDPINGYKQRFALHSENTNQTGHLNITVKSIPLSHYSTDQYGSHPGMVQREQAINAYHASKDDSLFRDAKIALSSLFSI